MSRTGKGDDRAKRERRRGRRHVEPVRYGDPKQESGILMLQGGGALLLENGDRLLLEGGE